MSEQGWVVQYRDWRDGLEAPVREERFPDEEQAARWIKRHEDDIEVYGIKEPRVFSAATGPEGVRP